MSLYKRGPDSRKEFTFDCIDHNARDLRGLFMWLIQPEGTAFWHDAYWALERVLRSEGL